jgi:hypothetical protein
VTLSIKAPALRLAKRGIRRDSRWFVWQYASTPGTFSASTGTMSGRVETLVPLLGHVETYTEQEIAEGYAQLGDRKLAIAGDAVAGAPRGPKPEDAFLDPAGLSGLLSAAVLSRGSDDRCLASAAFVAALAGIPALVAAVAAGTALPTGTIPAAAWGIYLLAYNPATLAFAVLPGSANYATGYVSEAAALAATPSPATGFYAVGTATVLPADTFPFVAATDALQGGSSGHPAKTTHYASAAIVVAPTIQVDNVEPVAGGDGIVLYVCRIRGRAQ